MLRPQDTSRRERKNLDGLWSFRIDTENTGRTDAWYAEPMTGVRDIAVPASYNDLTTDPAVRDHVGSAWYETTVWVPAGWSGQRIVLHFESATHRAVVWVDGVQVVCHDGGYTPFEADVTEHVTPGAPARITVEVDNTLTFQTIPPGVVQDTPHGRRQRYFHDFFNYSGLHRSVWLYTTSPDHFDEPPRQVRRLRSLGRMESCQGVRRRGTRPSCVSGRSGWSPRSGLITSRTGPR